MRSISSSLGYRGAAVVATSLHHQCSFFSTSRTTLVAKPNRSIFHDIEGGFGDRVPPSYHQDSHHPSDQAAPIPTPIDTALSQSSPASVDDHINFDMVLVEETPVPGILMIRLNNGPVNTLTLPVMRTLRYYLELAAESAEKRLGAGGVGPGVEPPRSRPNPWVEKANAKKNAGMAYDPAAKHKELVKMFEGVRGLVLSSAVKNVFSAGLDLDELLKVGEGFERKQQQQQRGEAVEGDNVPYYASFTTYWGEFQSLWLTLHTLPIPIIAAINGDAPAAGCILSMCCDYRVMAIGSSSTSTTTTDNDDNNNSQPPKPQRKYKIGITAARAGFCVPKFVAHNMRWTVATSRAAEELLTQGILLPAVDAVSPKYGLVDALSDTDDTVVVDAIHVAERWAGLRTTASLTSSSSSASSQNVTDIIPYLHTYWLVKYETRTELVSLLDTKSKRLEDVSEYISMLSSPSVYKSLKTYRESLSSKNKGNKE